MSEVTFHAFIESTYSDLRSDAAYILRHYPNSFTLTPTEVVHEAYLGLAGCIEEAPHRDRIHLRNIVKLKIRQVVLDYLKRKQSKKRGGTGRAEGGRPGRTGGSFTPSSGAGRSQVPLDELASSRVEFLGQTVELLDLSEGLDALRRVSTRLFHVVILHLFSYRSHEEIAHRLGVSPSTVQKEFRHALAWLGRYFQGSRDHEHDVSSTGPEHP